MDGLGNKESSEIPRKPRALYIEDDKTLEKLLPRFVTDFQFEVATTMPEAEKMLEEEWDAIITDYDIPGGNGFEIAQRLKDEGKGVPVVIISGRKFDPEELRERGVSYALQKPFQIEEARDTFNRLMESIQARKPQ